jgi:membrane protease YdiL (CAAX protease family)
MTGFFKAVDWRVFGVLLAAGLLGVLAVMPMAIEMVEGGAFGPAEIPAIPWPLIVALALVQNGILLSVVILIGMVLSERVGLRMDLIRAWTRGVPGPAPGSILLPGLVVGAVAGAVLVGIEAAFFLRHLPASMQALFEIPLWKRLLGGVVYGGITEELLMRLFLLSLVAWLLGRWWKTPAGAPAAGAFWAAILVVAVLFGLGHLPATSAVAPLTPLLVARALVLNGIAGVAFGYLYWKHGLEAAMAGHMGAHLVLQVPGVLLLTSLL